VAVSGAIIGKERCTAPRVDTSRLARIAFDTV
jgi:hypothetical protein